MKKSNQSKTTIQIWGKSHKEEKDEPRPLGYHTLPHKIER